MFRGHIEYRSRLDRWVNICRVLVIDSQCEPRMKKLSMPGETDVAAVDRGSAHRGWMASPMARSKAFCILSKGESGSSNLSRCCCWRMMQVRDDCCRTPILRGRTSPDLDGLLYQKSPTSCGCFLEGPSQDQSKHERVLLECCNS